MQRKGLFTVTGNTPVNGVICIGTSIKSRDVKPYNHNNTTNAVGISDLAYFGIDSSLKVI
jgi:phage tail sheath protein FI